MIGQGSPSSTAPRIARAKRFLLAAFRVSDFRIARVAAVVLWFWLAQRSISQEPMSGQLAESEAEGQEGDAQGDAARIRITWGGGQASAWRGEISLDGGSLSDLRIAGLNIDSQGSIWLEDGRLHVASLSARQVEGIEVAAHGRKDAKFLIDLTSDAKAPPLRAEVVLSDALRTGVLLKLDDRGNTLKVESAPGNGLNLRTDGRPLIFFPGEQFAFELRPTLADVVPGTALDIETTLSPARDKKTLWQSEQRLAVPIEGPPTLSLNVPLPVAEGVYEVRVSASRPPGFGKRFLPGTSTLLAEQNFQVVVLDAQSPRSGQAAQWESVLEIDPTSPRWWDRLPNWTQLRRIPGLNRGPLGSIRAGAVEHPLGRFIELPPPAPGGEPHWQAYSLPLEAIGLPHLMEIEYPTDQEQQLGISIVEPNSAGIVEGIGRDGGCYVEGLGRSGAHGRTTHRLVFWPRTQAPLLLLTNQHPTSAAHFGHIRVLKRDGTDLAPGLRAPTADRWVAAYISRPLLLETFGASNTQPATNAFNLPFEASRDDWQAHYDAATRLADYLRYAGYNSAVINVLGEGQAPYFSDRLSGPVDERQATWPAFEAEGLELLLRVFDREQLALVPGVKFDAPLPQLEKLRRGSDPQTSGLEWVGPEGRTWVATYDAAGRPAPHYNLLDPQVQQAMLEVVSELVDRYDHHPALAGVSVQLSSRGYAQLPPLAWGLDDATISRFQQDTGVQIAAAGPNRFAARYALVAGQHAEAWRGWRAARLSEFYKRLAAIVRKDHERRRLILATEESLDHPQWLDRVRPNILADNRVYSTMRDAGIQADLREVLPGIVFCTTYYVGPTVPLRDRAVDLEVNAAFTSQSEAGKLSGDRGALIYHRAQRHWLTSFAAKSPFRFASESSLVSQPLAHGAAARQAYATALAKDDFTILLDGGELLPLGQEDMLRDTRLVLQRLPLNAEVAQIEKQPILVKTYSESNGVTLLVVNTSPWHAEAQLILNLPQATAMESLADVDDGADAAFSARLAAGRQPWSVTLEPYAVHAVRVPVGGVRVVELQCDISDTAHAELSHRIAELSERDKGPHPYPSLVNPSFESLGGGELLPGWLLEASAGTATADLDATAPQDGKTSVYVENRGPYAVLESNGFPIPATGQFALTVYLRGTDAASKTEMRIVVEADQPGRPYRRAVAIGPTQPVPYRLSNEWKPFPLLVNDLPLDPRGEMRIKFEMTGAGEVWLDEIKTYDLLFPLPFYMYRQTEMLQLVKLIDAAQSSHENGKITDCVRMLEGYWPRFLAAYTPPLPLAVQPALPKEKSSSAPAQPQQPTAPSLSDKLKRLMPKLR
jgi:hypothetical protein